MLKGIDQRLSAEVVHALMLMGHGDDLVICDVNHPAASIAAKRRVFMESSRLQTRERGCFYAILLGSHSTMS